MQENKSYVFFRELPQAEAGAGPVGAQGVPLTPGRSLAVDAAYHALGTPIFVAAPDLAVGGAPFRRLMIAQDVGSAIKGPQRGDIFFGTRRGGRRDCRHDQGGGARSISCFPTVKPRLRYAWPAWASATRELETDAELWARVARSAKPLAKGRIAPTVEAPKPRAKPPAKEPSRRLPSPRPSRWQSPLRPRGARR